MASAPSPTASPRDRRSGHDQNMGRLKDDIQKGFDQFSKIVEVIRILELVNTPPLPQEQLIVDFMKFRDLVAHKGVDGLICTQMVCAFVLHCRQILGIKTVSHQPKTTENMNKKFARMADINVIICAEWFLKLFEANKLTKEKVSKWMNRTVQNSSFSDFQFTADNDRNAINVTGQGTSSSFDHDWLQEQIKQVENSEVSYSADAEEEFKQLYEMVKNI